MKRYLVFSGHVYYPEGGWCDFQGSFDYLADAVRYARGFKESMWYHIVDYHEQRILTKEEGDN